MFRSGLRIIVSRRIAIKSQGRVLVASFVKRPTHKGPPELAVCSAVPLLYYTLHIRNGFPLSSLVSVRARWFPFRVRGVSAGHSNPRPLHPVSLFLIHEPPRQKEASRI